MRRKAGGFVSYTVEYYELDDGSSPAEEFILAQNIKMQAKIFSVLTYLEAKGPALREPYSKSLGKGIFELRVKQSSDITRILYFFVVGRKAILTNGFVKKTQKTPPGEINRAKRYRAAYYYRLGTREE
jgi:phage-related protein